LQARAKSNSDIASNRADIESTCWPVVFHPDERLRHGIDLVVVLSARKCEHFQQEVSNERLSADGRFRFQSLRQRVIERLSLWSPDNTTVAIVTDGSFFAAPISLDAFPDSCGLKQSSSN
jgi:hypothetical protein